eukprot:jgi/Bigna1/145795/aug1.104_g20503
MGKWHSTPERSQSDSKNAERSNSRRRTSPFTYLYGDLFQCQSDSKNVERSNPRNRKSPSRCSSTLLNFYEARRHRKKIDDVNVYVERMELHTKDDVKETRELISASDSDVIFPDTATVQLTIDNSTGRDDQKNLVLKITGSKYWRDTGIQVGDVKKFHSINTTVMLKSRPGAKFEDLGQDASLTFTIVASDNASEAKRQNYMPEAAVISHYMIPLIKKACRGKNLNILLTGHMGHGKSTFLQTLCTTMSFNKMACIGSVFASRGVGDHNTLRLDRRAIFDGFSVWDMHGIHRNFDFVQYKAIVRGERPDGFRMNQRPRTDDEEQEFKRTAKSRRMNLVVMLVAKGTLESQNRHELELLKDSMKAMRDEEVAPMVVISFADKKDKTVLKNPFDNVYLDQLRKRACDELGMEANTVFFSIPYIHKNVREFQRDLYNFLVVQKIAQCARENASRKEPKKTIQPSGFYPTTFAPSPTSVRST